MKTILFLFVMLGGLLNVTATAQIIGSEKTTFVQKDRLWLQNANKEVVAQSGDSVSATYFATAPILLCFNRTVLPNEQRICVVQPASGVAVSAMYMDSPRLAQCLLNKIAEAGPGSSILFTISPKEKGSSAAKITSLQLYLK
jgi:hypothetical protein